MKKRRRRGNYGEGGGYERRGLRHRPPRLPLSFNGYFRRLAHFYVRESVEDFNITIKEKGGHAALSRGNRGEIPSSAEVT